MKAIPLVEMKRRKGPFYFHRQCGEVVEVVDSRRWTKNWRMLDAADGRFFVVPKWTQVYYEPKRKRAE